MEKVQHNPDAGNLAERRRNVERALREVRGRQELAEIDRLEAEHAEALEPELAAGCNCREVRS